MTEKIYTGTACGACDKYEVCGQGHDLICFQPDVRQDVFLIRMNRGLLWILERERFVKHKVALASL